MKIKSGFKIRLFDADTEEKAHIGSYLISLGVIFLFLGSGAALGIADNYLFFVAAIVCNFVEMVLHHKTRLKINSFLVFSIFVMVFMALYFIAGSYDRGTALSLLLYSVLIISVMVDDYNLADVKNIVNGVIVSSLVFSGLIVFFGHEFLYAGSAKYTYTQSYGSNITFEPNYVGTLLTLGFCLAVFSALNNGSDKKRVVYYATSSLFILLGLFLTGSRSALVSLLLFVFIIVLTMKPSKLKNRMLALAGLLVIAAIVLIVTNVIPANVYLRLLRTSYIDNSNMKRIADWSYGLRAMFSNPIFGNGPILTLDILMEKYGFHGDVHNTFLTIGVMCGVPVFLLFVFTIIKYAVCLYVSNERLLFSTFIAMIFEWNILACQLCVSTWITLIIVMIYVDNYFGKSQYST